MNPYRIIAEAATELANSLPTSTVETLAAAIINSDVTTIRANITTQIPNHHHRDCALRFVDIWRTHASDLDKETVAAALHTAAYSEQAQRDAHSVELVWTGPDTGAAPFRRTEQAILQVLDSAQHRITLVSFAVYRIPNVSEALVRAAKRGVKLTVIVETPDRLGGENEYSTLRALGPEVAACSSVFYWPKDKRPPGDNDKVGILHVKCAVADGQWLFLSSANLTQQAFTINMELGVLIRGGTLPTRVERQFTGLIHSGQLSPVD